MADNYFEQGIAAFEAGEYEQAIELLTRAYRLSLGDLAEILLYRGEAYAYLGDLEQALEDFNESIERNPYRAAAYNERGNARRFQGDYQNAVRDYTYALALEKDNIEAAYHRALAHEALGAYEAAEADLSHALDLNPGIASAYELRGRIRAAHRAYDGAIADLTRYLRMGGGREYDNQSEIQSQLLILRLQRFFFRLFRLA